MRVSTRLAAAFAVQIVLLGALVVYHARTIRDQVEVAHDLTVISSRVYRTANEQVSRVAQLEENAAKHAITRDAGYLARFEGLAGEFADDLDMLRSQTLTDAERLEVQRLSEQWASFRSRAGLDRAGVSDTLADDTGIYNNAAIDSLRVQSMRLGHASYGAMLAQLNRADTTARRAERVTWLLAGLALLLSTLVAVTIVRSIGLGLRRLTAGTHEVAQGRFAYRLPADGSDEFAQVARDFNRMTERLDELDTMKRDFVSKVSHDLKTPLASMQETIRALLDELPGPLTARQRRLLELNQQSGARLYGMLAKLLDLSRLEAGGVQPELGDVDVSSVIRDVAGMHASGIPVRLHLPEAPLVIRGDADRIGQVVQNLLENAVKFANSLVSVRAGQTLAAGGRGEKGFVDIVVGDDGPGVLDVEKQHIFERFHQGQAGRSLQGRGVGLGLAICKEIVTMHGGTITVEDREGGGSEFRVRLPVAPAHSNGQHGTLDASAVTGSRVIAGVSLPAGDWRPE